MTSVGVEAEAGAQADAAAQVDAGVPVDAGAQADAGAPVDAGAQADAEIEAGITVSAMLAGGIDPEDIRIPPATRRLQAQLAEKVGLPELARNFRRAAELTSLWTDDVLTTHDAPPRPRAAPRAQPVDIADRLDRDHEATLCAELVREATDAHERRGTLTA